MKRLLYAIPLAFVGALVCAPPVIAQEAAEPAATRPAKPEAWERRFAAAIKPNPLGVKMRVSVSETELTGRTQSEVMQQLSGGQPEAQIAGEGRRTPMSFQWRLATKWEPQIHLTSCQFKTVSVVIESAVDMPRLGSAAASDSAMRRWWEAFVDQRFDERVQVLKVIRDGGRDLYKLVRDLDARTCSALTMRANDIVRQAYEDLSDRALQAYAASRRPSAAASPPSVP